MNSFTDSLKASFETYMRTFYQENGRFDLNDFADFAITLLNHQVNTQLIAPVDKAEAAYYLVKLYNKGMGNRISESDMRAITELITKDFSLDLDLLRRIIG